MGQTAQGTHTLSLGALLFSLWKFVRFLRIHIRSSLFVPGTECIISRILCTYETYATMARECGGLPPPATFSRAAVHGKAYAHHHTYLVCMRPRNMARLRPPTPVVPSGVTSCQTYHTIPYYSRSTELLPCHTPCFSLLFLHA